MLKHMIGSNEKMNARNKIQFLTRSYDSVTVVADSVDYC